MVKFDITPVSSSIIMVVGVGGGGSNAVNHMFKLGIADVSFMVCNTDRQALDRSPIPNKIRLGETLTEGLGAGNKPERGRAAAEESVEEVKEAFRENNIKMVFVTAGMGGGTGTGAAPVIAKAAKEMGILTVAIVTIPFKTEGRRRILQALEGIDEIRHNVDSLLVINNENIHEIYGELTLSDAFGKADDILATAAKSIAEIITRPNNVNVDFADVQTVMKDSGIALMGSARGSGENRALEVAEAAMSSPLLNHRSISGARNVLLNITSGNKEVTLTETYKITQFVQERTGNDNETDLIWGAGLDETLGDDIQITVIATGFDLDGLPTVRDRYSDVVDKGKKTPPVSKGRETISLIDENPVKQAPKAQTPDDLMVVTHGGANEEPQQEDFQFGNTVIEAPLGSEPNYYWGESAGMPETPAEQNAETEALLGGMLDQVDCGDEQSGETYTAADYNTDGEVAPVTALTEEELENIPAFIRRRMKIETDVPAGGKISRETLKGDGPKRGGGSSGNGGHLFD